MVATAALLVGCTSGADVPEAGASPSPSASPSLGPGAAHLDLSDLPVPRVGFCDVLAADEVEQALAGPVADTAHHANGEEFEVTPGRVDIAHEWGCTFLGSDGTTARTWVFARPVREPEATTLVRRARDAEDCAFPESVVFGTPGVTSVCETRGRVADDGATSQVGRVFRARLEGLFGDSWMGCEVTEPLEAMTRSTTTRADVVQRAEQWCTEVVTTVAAS